MGIQITDTTLRDAHQSLVATRMRTKDMVGIVEEMDKVGFFSLEVWGGATFDTAIRFLNEDPWDRLKLIRGKAKNTRLQMLLRGQNLVGYRHYADDVVKEFIRLAVKNGIDVFRIFDALNDVRNMELAIKVAKDLKAHVQGTICYTTSPVHTIAGFVEMAVVLEKLGCDSLCIKDMAGLISPPATTELVKAIKKKVKIPLDLHSHCTSGMAPLSYQSAAVAGVDILDTAFSAFAWGSSQPPTESIVAALKDTPYDTGLDLERLYQIGEYFAALSAKYRTLLTAEVTRPSINVLLHQIPGGMISNLVSQLREQNALDKLNEVMLEVPRVRADMGYPPLVTPTSQIVGIQAVFNVLSGGRYKRVTKEVKDYLLGWYGRPPAEVNEEIRKQVIGNEPVISGRPADSLKPELEKLKEEGKKLGIIHKEEDLISYALYPQVALKFLRGELKEESMPPAAPITPSAGAKLDLPMEFSVDVDGEVFNVKVASVGGKAIEVEKPRKAAEPARGVAAAAPVEKPVKAKEPAAGAAAAPAEKPKKPVIPVGGAVVASMPGMIVEMKVKVGQKVSEGDVVAIIETMKMQNEVYSDLSGVVKEILAYEGAIVNVGDALLALQPE